MKKMICVENNIKVKEIDILDVQEMAENLLWQERKSNAYVGEMKEVITKVGHQPFELIANYLYELLGDFIKYEGARRELNVFTTTWGLRNEGHDYTVLINSHPFLSVDEDGFDILEDYSDNEEVAHILSEWAYFKRCVNDKIQRYYDERQATINFTEDKCKGNLKAIMEFEL